jgi:hypothetical protein
MGLEGTNFIDLTGSLIINLILMILSSFFMSLIHKLTLHFYKYWIARTIGMNTNPSESVGAGLQGAYMSGYMDIFICAVIIFLTDYKNTLETTSDWVAYCYGVFSLLISIFLPFNMWYRIH